MDTLIWTIAHGDLVARVDEDGTIDGDADLVAVLRERLAEPVTVYRRGTIAAAGEAAGPEGAPIELRPGDGRYVVARIRTLCASGAGFEILDCDWR